MEKIFLNCTWKYENGELFRISKWTKKWLCCNKVNPNGQGYISIEIKGRVFLLHRLVYLYHNMEWDIFDVSKENEIDHMNKNKLDNRIENLKNVTSQQNCENRATYAGKEIKGYSFNKKSKLWVAQWYEKKIKKSKYFKTALEAKEHRELMTKDHYRPCKNITHQT